MLPQPPIEIEQAHPGADDCFPARQIDGDLIQAADVDHQTVIDHRERLVAMTTGASTQRDAS
jgi:hypothetical protein